MSTQAPGRNPSEATDKQRPPRLIYPLCDAGPAKSHAVSRPVHRLREASKAWSQPEVPYHPLGFPQILRVREQTYSPRVICGTFGVKKCRPVLGPFHIWSQSAVYGMCSPSDQLATIPGTQNLPNGHRRGAKSHLLVDGMKRGPTR